MLCMLMAFLVAAVTLAFYFSYLLNSFTKGFGSAAIFFTFVALLVNWKKGAVERFTSGIAIRRYFAKHGQQETRELEFSCRPNEGAPPLETSIIAADQTWE